MSAVYQKSNQAIPQEILVCCSLDHKTHQDGLVQQLAHMQTCHRQAVCSNNHLPPNFWKTLEREEMFALSCDVLETPNDPSSGTRG